MFQSKTVKGSAIRVSTAQGSSKAASAQDDANLGQEAASEGAQAINPMKRPASDTVPPSTVSSTNAKGAQAPDERFVEDLLAELKEEEQSPRLPPATPPKRQSPAPLLAPRAATPREQERQAEPAAPREKGGSRAGEEAGRVVLNHSTHIPGLLPVLHRLVQTSGIRTAVPGRLYTAGGHEAGLGLRITVPTAGGFKLLARRGTQTQEVFVVTDLDRDTMLAAIAWAL